MYLLGGHNSTHSKSHHIQGHTPPQGALQPRTGIRRGLKSGHRQRAVPVQSSPLDYDACPLHCWTAVLCPTLLPHSSRCYSPKRSWVNILRLNAGTSESESWETHSMSHAKIFIIKSFLFLNLHFIWAFDHKDKDCIFPVYLQCKIRGVKTT